MIKTTPLCYCIYATGYVTSLQGIRNVPRNRVFGNEVYGSDSEGFRMNPLSNEFRLCNSDGWRSGNHGGRVIICGYGVSPWNKEVFGSSDHKILTNPSSSLLISMILIDQVCEDMKFPRVLRGIYRVEFAWGPSKALLILEVEERLLLFEEEIDNDFGKSREWHVFTS
ncbi:hypothetical protein Tco_0659153 [Tanacetum coccineum]